MTQDYPDGFRRNLPGHTVDLESGFSLPWCESTSLTIAAAGNSSFTVNFSGTDFIYYVDMVNVSPQAYTEFYIFVEVNGVTYTAGANMGFIILPLRTNPSINFIGGDSIKVTIYNKDASQRTFVVHINGSKIVRPASFGHVPGAQYSFSPSVGFAPLAVTFTDESTNSPTSWEWMVNGVDVDSTEQNPTITALVGGTYYPLLKAINEYGYDTYSSSQPLVVASRLPLSLFSESDPSNRISGLSFPITITGITRAENAYIARYYGVGYFDAYDILIAAKITGGTALSYVVVGMLGLNAPALVTGGGINVVVEFYRPSSSTQQIMLRLHNGATVIATDTYDCSINTVYYMRLVHVTGSTTVTLYIYSGATFDSLVDTLVITNASVATKFVYLFACSSFNDGYSYSASAVINGSGIISVS